MRATVRFYEQLFLINKPDFVICLCVFTFANRSPHLRTAVRHLPASVRFYEPLFVIGEPGFVFTNTC
jgi:hypothetical protein